MSFTSTEYQHFIPQFILKNYSYPFKCPNAEQKGKKKCKCKHEKGKYPGDLVTNCMTLSPPHFQLETFSVKRIFGVPNMYNDPAQTTSDKQRRIEAMFSKMESQASIIFRRIVKTHEAGGTIVTLNRTELYFIRKFLFLLKYRGSPFHHRFYHDKPEDYCSNDRELLLEYMKEHRFSTPRDVWYHNLETIINLEMDPERKWIHTLPQKMFPDDALWCIMHCDSYYMAICTTSEATDEFILTDNCYNVFEGPNTFRMDITGQVIPSDHAGYHQFAPISPRLIIVLRSLALPIPEEDYDREISQMRNDALWSSFQQTFGQWNSILEDLPIKKCRNNYSEIINGEVHPGARYDGKFRPTDKFHFTFFPIKSSQVITINNIFLDNAYSSSTIAFQDPEKFKKLLESYVSGPCDNHKIVGGDDSDSRYSFLRGLETFVKHQGSQKSLVWKPMKALKASPTQPFMNKQLEFRRIGMRRFQKSQNHHDPMGAFFELYIKFGRISMFHRDLAQAGKMIYFQTVVEALSVGCSLMIQRRNKAIIFSMFKASYCSRYWIYLKLLRKSQCGDRDGTQDVVDIFADKNIREGPEDIFGRTSQLYTENTLNDLMQITVYNGIAIRKYKIESLWAKASDSKNIFSHAQLHVIIFDHPGKIRDCGKLTSSLIHITYHLVLIR
ncbi:hypothetical protein GGI42DRAFT_312700 [Trichoderma sp. SZMC 28013]